MEEQALVALEMALRHLADRYGHEIEAYAKARLAALVDDLLQDIVGISLGDLQKEQENIVKLVVAQEKRVREARAAAGAYRPALSAKRKTVFTTANPKKKAKTTSAEAIDQ